MLAFLSSRVATGTLLEMKLCVVAGFVWLAACGDQTPGPAGPVDSGQDAVPLSSAKDLSSFTFLAADNPVLATDAPAVITGTTVAASARFVSNVTALKPTFETTGVNVLVGSTAQISGNTAQDFRDPVTYTVVAEDGSSKNYTVTLATPSFAPKVDFATGLDPSSVAIADFNRDGKPDLAVANGNAATVSVLLDTTVTGSLIPTFSAKQDFATGSGPVSVAIGDFNGDGKLDLAVANQSGTVSILLGTTATGAASPTFAAKVDLATGPNATSMAIADFNGDGKPDLAVTHQGPGESVSILLNTTAANAATPSFSAKVEFDVGPVPFSVAVGDLNRDGKPDVVVATVGGFRPVSVLINLTATDAVTPSFAAKDEVLIGENSQAVTVGDVNGDGIPDLVIADANPVGALVMLNTTAMGAATTSYAPAAVFASGIGPSSIVIGDLNGDGTSDLAVASRSATVGVLLGTTATGALTPSFLPRIEFSTGFEPTSIAMGDFNGDGKPDLASANFNPDTVSVLLAQ